MVLNVLSIVAAQATEEELARRVHAHLLIGDARSAYAEAQAGASSYPHSKLLLQTAVRAAAKQGEERAMMRYWQSLTKQFPEEQQNRDLLECLAWSIIQNGFKSASPLIRVMAMLGGYFSRDAKGVAILRQGLRDENAALRAAAIQLSVSLCDASLQEELLHLCRSDRSWEVRLEAIKAIGEMKMGEAKEELCCLITGKEAHIEEQAAAIQALVLLSDGSSPEQLQRLIQSSRAGMRLLACECIAYFEQHAYLHLLLPLLSDPQARVRARLYQTLGRLRATTLGDCSVASLAVRGTTDPDPDVALSAAWLLLIHDQSQGELVFEKWLHHPSSETRQLAAAAVAAAGRYGVPLALKYFRVHVDPYVRMNLALGLIGQRVERQAAADCLYEGLQQKKERWMWQEARFFRVLAPSKVKHNDAVQDYPEAVNQLARLEVLQILCMLEYPRTQQALKDFLQEKRWEVSGLASALLLTEGDEAAIDRVKELLNDPDPEIRIQGALILALWGKEEAVVNLLQQHYDQADPELKGKILEGIGRVGSTSSLSFLVERLKEGRPSLRIIAAAALLECLYH